jgi:hypothetical protein
MDLWKSSSSVTEPPGWAKRARRNRWIIAVTCVAVVGVVVALATVPVSQTTSFRLSSSITGNVPNATSGTANQTLCPVGAVVSVSFSAPGFTDARVSVVAPNGTTLWSQEGPSASTSWTVTTCGVYLFTIAGTGFGTMTVNGTVHFTAPLL